MSEQIKMTEGELSEVRVLQDKYQKNIFQLGQTSLRKLEAEQALKSTKEDESKLHEEFNKLRQIESALIDTLLKKYGEGSLDLKAGVFTAGVSK